MKNEADVKTAVKKILSGMEKCWWYMPVQTGYGVKGIPDFVCCINGRTVGIETKFGRNKESAWQKKQGAAIRAAGGVYFVVYENGVETLAAKLEML